MKFYVLQTLIALDQLANALLFGHADETLSARAWRASQAGKTWGVAIRATIDALFFIITLGRDKNHCWAAYQSEVERRQLPRVYS